MNRPKVQRFEVEVISFQNHLGFVWFHFDSRALLGFENGPFIKESANRVLQP